MSKIRVFWDMDGTLAKWRSSATFSDLYKKGYFASLEPETALCKLANKLFKRSELENYILTSFLTDSAYAKDEKLQWLKNNIPDLKLENVICVPYGIKKSSFVEDASHKELSEKDILIDDHSPNLISWETAGGKSVKWINGVNNSGKSTYSGTRINDVFQIEHILDSLLYGIKG